MKNLVKITLHKYIVFSFLILLSACTGQKKKTTTKTIFCAAGLSEYITEVKDSLEVRGFKIHINIASSGTLARQIANGNNSDIFISANRNWANYLDSLELADTLVPFCKTSLVLIAPTESPLSSLDDLLLANRIAIGNPSYVPAGEYAKQTLTKLGLYKKLEDKYIFTKDVKSVLRLVEMNECNAGFVYYSDLLASSKNKAIDIISDTLHEPIVFYLLKVSDNSQEIFEYLTSKESADLLNKYGLNTFQGP